MQPQHPAVGTPLRRSTLIAVTVLAIVLTLMAGAGVVFAFSIGVFDPGAAGAVAATVTQL